MIGTIIIALIGYGVTAFFVLGAFYALLKYGAAPAGSDVEKMNGSAVLPLLGVAVIIAFFTRLLAGV
ncbi:hypothetical protein [Azorhizobium doebereinerae]|uniref:hypothetical protein n=1 Tax=Azorhizobium doebereinerae TaxID=281091 RepID=UPI00040A356F|nr:hypothetical protein [Azorhizobium doebereinerae]